MMAVSRRAPETERMTRQQQNNPQGRTQAGNPGQQGQRGEHAGERTNTTEVRCRSCDQTFRSQDQLREHERSTHRGQSRS